MTAKPDESSELHAQSTAEHKNRSGDFVSQKLVADEFKALGTRLLVLFAIVLSVAIDLAFLAAWVGLHQAAEVYIFHWLGTLPGMTGALKVILEIIFISSTLAGLAAYVARDIYLAARRSWRLT